jgi:hypothetical protein
MTKAQLAEAIKQIQETDPLSREAEDLVTNLCDDLGYVDAIARLVPQSVLDEMLTDDTPLW